MALLTLLIPIVMLAVILALDRYEDFMLTPRRVAEPTEAPSPEESKAEGQQPTQLNVH